MNKTRKASTPSPKKPAKKKSAVEEARELYDQGVLSRGEAAARTKDGELPLPFTHEIVKGKIIRRRYSAV